MKGIWILRPFYSSISLRSPVCGFMIVFPAAKSLSNSLLATLPKHRQMPKDVRGPVSALFAVAKPSGPTSMAIVNDIKRLVTRSRLFVKESELKKVEKQQPKRGRKDKYARQVVKIGQGGTLDPLADGVLGN